MVIVAAVFVFNSFASILAVESSSKLGFDEKECNNISKQRSSEVLV